MNWVMSNGNKWSSLRSLFTDVVFNWACLFMPFWVCVFTHSPLWCVLFKGSSSTWFLLFFFFFRLKWQGFLSWQEANMSKSLFRFWINPEVWSPLHLHLDGVQMWDMRILTRCWKIWRIQCDLNKASRQKFDEKLLEWFIPSSCQIELKR